MDIKHSILFALPLVAAAAQAQALTAGSLTARWVQGDASVVPHSIAGAEALLALQPGDPGFIEGMNTTGPDLDFLDRSSDTNGLFANNQPDPFTVVDAAGNPLTDPTFAVSVTGTLLVAANADFSFVVHSDDGFDFRIDGASVFQFDGDRGPSTSRIDLVALTAGSHDFELIGWEQGGQFVLELGWAPNGSENFHVLSTTPVPVPAALPLMASALAGLGLRRRRRC